MLNRTRSQVWLTGGGVASLAAAAFLIRDAGVAGERIHILEELPLLGGALDGARSRTKHAGFVTRGGRMLEDEAYQCLWNLLETIPSLEEPSLSVRQEIRQYNERWKTDAKARLIAKDVQILDASQYGFNARDRLELMRLLAMPEHLLGTRRIDELFSEHFLSTPFWQMWRTMFAFQNWHSAIELRRYCLRFVQEFPKMHTLSGIRRTKHNQFDSIVRPLQRWLLDRGVDARFGTKVVDVDFDLTAAEARRVTRLHVVSEGTPQQIEIGADDVALFTLGSITADSTYADNETVPELIRGRRDGGWSLWEAVAKKAKDFGRPSTFYGNVDDNKWESFTLTMKSEALLQRIVKLTGNEPGTGGLMTFVASAWLLTIAVPHQPHFLDLPEGSFTLWGDGLLIDAVGNFVKKPMAQCTGHEVLAELLGHLGCSDIADEVMASTDVATVMLPYASAVFAPRAPADRPLVVPKGAMNFGFLGQFTEMPGDVVFTVEYSVHSAMHAVYTLFGVEKQIPPLYNGVLDPRVGLAALESVFK